MTEESSTVEAEKRPIRKRRDWRLIALVVVLVSLLIIVVYAYPVSSSVAFTWNISSVDSKGQVYEIDSARDSNGRLHIVYCGHRGLTYAHNTGAGWNINPLGFSGRYCSIAVDSGDHEHIAALVSDSNRSLVYATNSHGTWQAEIVDTGVWGWPISLALDSEGNAYISYSSNYSIRYVTNSGGPWQDFFVAESSNGDSTTIIIDLEDRIHIFQTDPVAQYTYENGTWVRDLINYWDLTGDKVSAALDSDGDIHISFFGSERNNNHNWGLLHGVNESGTWVLTFLDKLGSWGGQESSIGLDRNDGIHISYQDFDSGRLKYARNVDGNWETKSLTNGGTDFYHRVVGNTNDMIVEPSGDVHIFFSETPDAPLSYATDDFPPTVLTLSLTALVFKLPLGAVIAARERPKKKDDLLDDSQSIG